MRKILRFFFVLLLVIAAIFVTATTAKAAFNDNQVELILHKYIARDLVSPDIADYPNDGLAINDATGPTIDVVSKATPLNGANFSVYDLTDYYYRDTESGEEFVKKISAYNHTQIQQLIQVEELQQVANSPIKTITDIEFGRGIGRLFLPREKAGKNCVYLVVEAKADESVGFTIDIDERAIPIAVVLPITDPSDPSKELQQIHIYPKNVGYVRNPYFFKLGRDITGQELTPLEGVTFALFQIVDQHKLYLQQSPVDDMTNQWLPSAKPLEDMNVAKFISDKDGVVTTHERYLSSGTYYFEELKAAMGYQITDTEKKIEVIIPESWHDNKGNHLYVTVNGYRMDELVSGKIPESAYQNQEPRVYNELIKTPPQTPGGKLPNTGAVKSIVSIVGIIFIVVAWFVKRRTGRKEST